VRTILGRLVNSSRKNTSTLEDSVRHAYSLACSFLQHVHTHSRHFYAMRLQDLQKARTRQYVERVLFAQRLQTGPVTLRQSGSVLDRVLSMPMCSLSDGQLAISTAFDGCE